MYLNLLNFRTLKYKALYRIRTKFSIMAVIDERRKPAPVVILNLGPSTSKYRGTKFSRVTATNFRPWQTLARGPAWACLLTGLKFIIIRPVLLDCTLYILNFVHLVRADLV